MDDTLTTALDDLIDRHRRLGSIVPDFLRPGRDPAEIRAAIEALGVDPPDELVELFAWHDGLDAERWPRSPGVAGYPRLWGDVFFDSLDGSIEARETYLEIDRVARETQLSAYGSAGDDTWHPGWFPAFAGGSSETYAVDCRDAPTRGSAFEVTWHPGPFGDPPLARFRSLSAMIRAIVRRFDAGVYAWDPEVRWFDQDDELLNRFIASELAQAD